MSSSSNDDDQNKKPCFIDRIKTEMNACSLEVLRNFQQQSNNNNNNDDDECGVNNTLPTVIGCYQLEDTNTASDKVEEDSTKSSSVRKGSLRLYMIDHDKNSISPQFDKPTNICETEAGILDGKWFQSGKLRIQVENNDEKEESKILERSHHVYASACASGKIWLHYLADNNDDSSPYERNTTSCLKALGCSSCNQDENKTSLCLALDIDERNIHTDGLLETGCSGEARIVSSYSDGSAAIHSVSFGQQYNDTEEEKDPNEIVEIIKEEERWDCAHKLFGGIPAEVWSCCWSKSDNNLILTGGDDCKLKGWDISRGSNSKPVFQIGQDEFEAGVTCLSWHPNSSLHPYTFASGSYDEGIRIWDARQMNRPLLKSKLESCGGGVWRMKWHPKCPEKLLVGAMHGGCRILEIPSLSSHTSFSNSTIDLVQEKDEYEIKITKSFTLHESMAYGADWLTNNIAVSCSFYDQQSFMWEIK